MAFTLAELEPLPPSDAPAVQAATAANAEDERPCPVSEENMFAIVESVNAMEATLDREEVLERALAEAIDAFEEAARNDSPRRGSYAPIQEQIERLRAVLRGDDDG